jgi:AGZA family xanthine/uracil permease-like MFS transporter
MNAATPAGARLWVAGDLNGFFGLFTNVLLNVIVLTGLCLGVVQLPADTVFGRILPALGIALPLGNLFYAWLAWQLAKTEGRADVTAMPYGPSVPHMFIVVFVIMLPVYLTTKDPMLAWQAGLAWCVHDRRDRACIGAFVGPLDPRADAARGDARHAGGHLDHLHLDAASRADVGDPLDRPGLLRDRPDRFWTANLRMPGGLPGGLVAVVVGAVIGWIAALLGWSD